MQQYYFWLNFFTIRPHSCKKTSTQFFECVSISFSLFYQRIFFHQNLKWLVTFSEFVFIPIIINYTLDSMLKMDFLVSLTDDALLPPIIYKKYFILLCICSAVRISQIKFRFWCRLSSTRHMLELDLWIPQTQQSKIKLFFWSALLTTICQQMAQPSRTEAAGCCEVRPCGQNFSFTFQR